MIDFITKYQISLIIIGVLIIMGFVGYWAEQNDALKREAREKSRKDRLAKKEELRRRKEQEKEELRRKKEQAKEEIRKNKERAKEEKLKAKETAKNSQATPTEDIPIVAVEPIETALPETTKVDETPANAEVMPTEEISMPVEEAPVDGNENFLDDIVMPTVENYPFETIEETIPVTTEIKDSLTSVETVTPEESSNDIEVVAPTEEVETLETSPQPSDDTAIEELVVEPTVASEEITIEPSTEETVAPEEITIEPSAEETVAPEEITIEPSTEENVETEEITIEPSVEENIETEEIPMTVEETPVENNEVVIEQPVTENVPATSTPTSLDGQSLEEILEANNYDMSAIEGLINNPTTQEYTYVAPTPEEAQPTTSSYNSDELDESLAAFAEKSSYDMENDHFGVDDISAFRVTATHGEQSSDHSLDEWKL